VPVTVHSPAVALTATVPSSVLLPTSKPESSDAVGDRAPLICGGDRGQRRPTSAVVGGSEGPAPGQGCPLGSGTGTQTW
jgi:hypothetical protein